MRRRLGGRLGAGLALLGLVGVVACAPTATAPAAPARTEAAAVVGAADGPAAAPPTRERLRIVYPVASNGHLHVWLAQEAGYYAAEGVDAELQFMSGVPTIVAAMLAGEVDIASITGAPAIAASLQGADLLAIAHPIGRFSQTLFSRPEIPSGAELRGKTVGVVAPGSSSDIAARHALRRLGLDPDHDVTFTRTGGVPETLTAMLAGGIDAGMLSQPIIIQARRNGMVELLDLSRVDVEYPTAGVIVSQRLVVEREEAALRFLRAIGRAVHRIKSDPAYAQAAIGRFSQVDDPEILAEGYQSLLPLLRDVPTPTRSGTEVLMEEVAFSQPAVRATDPSRFYDPHLVERLEAEGFYRRLFGS